MNPTHAEEPVVNPLPKSENPLVIRTDFADDAAWEAVRAEAQAPVYEIEGEPWYANLDFLDDRAAEGLTAEAVLTLDARYPHSFVVLADAATFASAEHPLLAVDLIDYSEEGDDEEDDDEDEGGSRRGRTFRCLPTTLQSIENNLSISNMDFSEFADAVDEDGVFRGF